MQHLRTLMAAFFALAGFSSLGANPKGEKVAHGSASFNRENDSALTVKQASDKAVIHWDSFSIGQGEITQFLQPSSNSSILNRVTGPLKSEIFGTLKANGKVLLLNKNGVLIGESGVIQTGGFLASTLDISDEAFMQGEPLSFSGDSKEGVVNLSALQMFGDQQELIKNIVNTFGTVDAKTIERSDGKVFLLGEGALRQSLLEESETLEGVFAIPPFFPPNPIIQNLTNVERMPPNTDYSMQVLHKEFGIYPLQNRAGNRRIFRKSSDTLQYNTGGKNEYYFTQIVIDGQRVRLMDAKILYPFAGKDKEP